MSDSAGRTRASAQVRGLLSASAQVRDHSYICLLQLPHKIASGPTQSMLAEASPVATPDDSTPGPEEPVVIKMNKQRTKLGMPVSAPAQLTCTPTCATPPTCAATL